MKLMERCQSKKTQHFLQYCVFDVIYYNGKKIATKPLFERKEILSNLDFDQERIVTVQWTEVHGVPYFNLEKRGI